MKKLVDVLSCIVGEAFQAAGYEMELGKVGISNRPDLCEFQCNGAMAGAKKYKKAPIAIANDVVSYLEKNEAFSFAEAVMPGFLNLKVSESFLLNYLKDMNKSPRFGYEREDGEKKVVIDYGGPNVAKPLHVGHLRSAIIGESIKRIARYSGDTVTGDIHMGDWGLQIGLIITELKERKPDLPYFDPEHKGDYPKEAPFTISELEEIYPFATARSKESPEYKEKAMEATKLLQDGNPGARALWKHIMDVSVADLKRNYDRLKVDFDLWNGESDVQELIAPMVKYMKEGGWAHESQGALVVDVKREDDTKEIPPCMILKSDGASLYNTTDLATIMERMEKIKPDRIIYVVDKRQELYFEQVFRCARITKLVNDDTELIFKGFGTVNGKDGKAYKTRAGGVMRLESLLSEVYSIMLDKIKESDNISPQKAEETALQVSLAALKYGDLSNQASKDYIFDMEKFTSSEGDTGPYILYTIVRINSILEKYKEQGKSLDSCSMLEASSASQKELMLAITGFHQAYETAYKECAPHRICAYIYELSNAFNRFYHEVRILALEDEKEKASYISLLMLTKDILNVCIELLGFEAPEKM